MFLPYPIELPIYFWAVFLVFSFLRIWCNRS